MSTDYVHYSVSTDYVQTAPGIYQAAVDRGMVLLDREIEKACANADAFLRTLAEIKSLPEVRS